MGRRNLTSTKHGRFMNPTDQARKEARKKELRRNKKQRIAVRHAALKSRDPLQLIEEANILDKQEQVKLAERVKASEIPLPKFPQLGLPASDIPLPMGNYAKSILKKAGIPGLPPSTLPVGKKPPGPPPGTPPDLSDSDGEEGLFDSVGKSRKIRFADSNLADDDSNLQDQQLQAQDGFSKSASDFTSILSLSQIPLPPPMALPSFNGMVRPGFTGVQNNSSRFTFHRPMSAVLSAPPSLHHRDPLDNADLVGCPAVPSAIESQHVTETIIEAKPQLKNLIGDATRFVPTALKVRRITRDQNGRIIATGGGINFNESDKKPNAVFDRIQRQEGMGGYAGTIKSKDDAYDEFMREMDGLL